MRLLLIVCALLSHANCSDLVIASGASDDLIAGSYTYDHVQVSSRAHCESGWANILIFSARR